MFVSKQTSCEIQASPASASEPFKFPGSPAFFCSAWQYKDVVGFHGESVEKPFCCFRSCVILRILLLFFSISNVALVQLEFCISSLCFAPDVKGSVYWFCRVSLCLKPKRMCFKPNYSDRHGNYMCNGYGIHYRVSLAAERIPQKQFGITQLPWNARLSAC